jgi:hypothetical protein
MAVGLYQAVVQLVRTSGLPEDTVENVFHFKGDPLGGTVASEAADIATMLKSFYNDTFESASTDVANYIGRQISRAANVCKVVVYHKDDFDRDTLFGSPDHTLSFTLDPAQASTTEFPSEVAICCSFHGDLTDVPETVGTPPNVTRPAARRRGRLYIGPLNSAASAGGGATPDPLTSANVQNALGRALRMLRSDDSPTRWGIWSKADEEFYEIEGGYIDQAFDTQRRRGVASSARISWFP